MYSSRKLKFLFLVNLHNLCGYYEARKDEVKNEIKQLKNAFSIF